MITIWKEHYLEVGEHEIRALWTKDYGENVITTERKVRRWFGMPKTWKVVTRQLTNDSAEAERMWSVSVSAIDSARKSLTDID